MMNAGSVHSVVDAMHAPCVTAQRRAVSPSLGDTGVLLVLEAIVCFITGNIISQRYVENG